MEYQLLVGIVVSLLFSAFFSGIEMAFVSADKLHIELVKNSGSFTGKLLGVFSRHPGIFIGTTLMGNTIALVLYGIYMTQAMEPFFSGLGLPSAGVLVSQTLVSTMVVLATAEFLPKSLFLINPNRMLSVFAFPMRLMTFIFYPAVVIVVGFSRFLIRYVFRGNIKSEQPIYSLVDLNNFIREVSKATNNNDENVEVNAEIFSNAVEFKKVKVRECMIPRTEIIALDQTASMEELKSAFVDSGHSKVLIYKESIDDIIGYCHSLQMFKKPKNVREIISEIDFVPETKLANELLIEFIEKHKSVAVVVDEFGGTSGIVTIEDVIEEIFGEIRDEHDEEDLDEQQIDQFTYLFSARHEIDYINERHKLNLPKGDYDTLGGYILTVYGDIPKVNDVIKDYPYRFVIKSMDGIRMDKIKVIIDADEEDQKNNG